MSLFKWGKFTSHSGVELDFKIDCDALTDDDWECIASIIAKKYTFGSVYGIPNGGIPLEKALVKYRTPESPTRLVVDDVWTTGKSMYDEMKEDDIGIVVFARNPIPRNVHVDAIFTGACL